VLGKELEKEAEGRRCPKKRKMQRKSTERDTLGRQHARCNNDYVLLVRLKNIMILDS
jgi:hypothetical protein